jgi:hypothetical protein
VVACRLLLGHVVHIELNLPRNANNANNVEIDKALVCVHASARLTPTPPIQFDLQGLSLYSYCTPCFNTPPSYLACRLLPAVPTVLLALLLSLLLCAGSFIRSAHPQLLDAEQEARSPRHAPAAAAATARHLRQGEGQWQVDCSSRIQSKASLIA